MVPLFMTLYIPYAILFCAWYLWSYFSIHSLSDPDTWSTKAEPYLRHLTSILSVYFLLISINKLLTDWNQIKEVIVWWSAPVTFSCVLYVMITMNLDNDQVDHDNWWYCVAYANMGIFLRALLYLRQNP